MSNHSNVSLEWQACGGEAFTGPTTCVPGFICVEVNKWFSQCYSAPPLGGKTCITCGRPNTDVAGIGVLIFIAIQCAFALALTLWADRLNHHRAQNYVIRVLLCVTNVQTINAIGLLISAIVYNSSEDLYHLRLIYDDICLAGISLWPANMLLESRHDAAVRRVSSCLFVALYLTFVVLLLLRLQNWDNESSGQCYEHGFLYLTGPTPYIAAFSSLLILFIIGSLWPPQQWWTFGLVPAAAIQALVPLLSIASLRSAEQNFLVGGQSDNEFGYGQIIIMISFLAIIFETHRIWRDYRESVAFNPSPVALGRSEALEY